MLLQALVLLLRILVLLLQALGVHVAPSPQELPDVINHVRIGGLFVLLVKLDEHLGELVDCARLLQVVLELGFLGINFLSGGVCTSDIFDDGRVNINI